METDETLFDKNRYCKKCLLKDMPENAYFKNLYAYIAGLNEDIKAEAKEYERRLVLCKECDNLLDGMCRICGCYVELRAAVAKNYCPNIEKKW